MGCCCSKSTVCPPAGTQRSAEAEVLKSACTGVDGAQGVSSIQVLSRCSDNKVSSRGSHASSQKHSEDSLLYLVQDLKAVTYTKKRPFKVTLFALLALLYSSNPQLVVNQTDEFPFVSFDAHPTHELQWVVDIWQNLVSAVKAVIVSQTSEESPFHSSGLSPQVQEVLRDSFKFSKQLTNQLFLQTLMQVGRILSDSELTDQQLVKEVEYAGGFTMFR